MDNDVETTFERPHEWPRDPETGEIVYIYGDNHTYLECLVCDVYACYHCRPDIWTEPCGYQEEPMVSISELFNPKQLKERFTHLTKLGYFMRGGVVVGRGDPIPECKPGMHKTRVIEKTFSGEGINKRAHIIEECVVCLRRFRPKYQR